MKSILKGLNKKFFGDILAKMEEDRVMTKSYPKDYPDAREIIRIYQASLKLKEESRSEQVLTSNATTVRAIIQHKNQVKKGNFKHCYFIVQLNKL